MIVKTRKITGILKFCFKCTKFLDTSLFNLNRRMKFGLDSACWNCRKLEAKLYYWANADRQRKLSKAYSNKNKDKIFKRKLDNPQHYLWLLAKHRAKKNNIPFSIDESDIIIPEFCPVLGLKLIFSNGKHSTDASPTLDKFTPELGYVKGNITVISKRANRLKGDANYQEIKKLANWMYKRI